MANRSSEYIKQEEDDEAGEDYYDEANYKTQKDAVLFAIDVSPSMAQAPPPSKSKKADRDSPLSAALRCAYQIMQQRIIAQPKDLMGILFFGTDKSRFCTTGDGHGDGDGGISHVPSYPHCYLFMDLDVPAAEDVRALRGLVDEQSEGSGDSGGDADGVLVPATAVPAASMANVLFCANQIFTTKAANFGSRRLFIITDRDDPHPGDKAARSAAAVRAKDLYDLGVGIELFPISPQSTSAALQTPQFDLSKFYDDIIYRDPSDASMGGGALSSSVVVAKSGDGLTLLSSLISHISAKQTPKRAYFSGLTFSVAPGLEISVKGYILLNRQKPARTCYVWTDGEKALLATSETVKTVAPDGDSGDGGGRGGSGRAVEAGETKKAYKFGGEFLYFSPEELQVLRKWQFPDGWMGKGLRIIGFKPRALIPAWASVKKSTFVFPSEEDYVGSTRVFSALWQKLRTSAKVAIAWFVPRTNANPRLVAIMPSEGGSLKEEADRSEAEKKEQGGNGKKYANPLELPAGLWLYPLPFAEDIRKFDDNRPPAPGAAQLADLLKPVVENLYLPKMAFNPTKYPNPALQWHYRVLQAAALDDELPTAADDATLPKYKAIDKRVGGSLADLKESIDHAAGRLAATRAMKRDADDDVKPLSKRPKTSGASAAAAAAPLAAMSNKDLRKLIDTERLASLTVPALREILATKGLSGLGHKKVLLDRIEQWAEQNLAAAVSCLFPCRLAILLVVLFALCCLEGGVTRTGPPFVCRHDVTREELLRAADKSGGADCSSVEELGQRLARLLEGKMSATHAQHVMGFSEIPSHVVLDPDAERTTTMAQTTPTATTSIAEAAATTAARMAVNQIRKGVGLSSPESLRLGTKTVRDVVMSQAEKGTVTVLQQAVAELLMMRVRLADGSAWTVQSATPASQG